MTMVLNCYVLDDEMPAIDLLSKYIQKTPGLKLIGAASNPLQALDEITNNDSPPDITFVDIDMPDLSGLEFAEFAKSRTEIIFTTAYPQHAAKAFETPALDYLVKPFSYERFLKGVDRARKKAISLTNKTTKAANDDYFFIKSDGKGKIAKIWHNDIIFIEGKLNYVHIHTRDNIHVTYLTMKEFEDILPKDIFFRVHKSFIVNGRKIKAIAANHIILQNDAELTIGASYRKGLFSKEIDQKLLKSKRLP